MMKPNPQKKTIVKVRLTRYHYLNGTKKPAGSVVKLDQVTADWLVSLRRAKPQK